MSIILSVPNQAASDLPDLDLYNYTCYIEDGQGIWYLYWAPFGLSEYAAKRSICFCGLKEKEKESTLAIGKGEACHSDHRFG